MNALRGRRGPAPDVAADADEVNVLDRVLHAATFSITAATVAVASGRPSARAALAIASSRSRVSPSSRLREPFGRQLGLRQVQRGALAGHELGVGALVLCRRHNQRHQNARHARHRKFRDGDRAGAAQHDIGLGIALRDVVDERHDLGVDAGRR